MQRNLRPVEGSKRGWEDEFPIQSAQKWSNALNVSNGVCCRFLPSRRYLSSTVTTFLCSFSASARACLVVDVHATCIMKRKTTRQPRSRPSSRMAETETIEHDDLCAICHCLMLRPVTTTCNHTLCAECMKVWSDISITDQRQIVGLEDVPTTCLPSEMESRCPMCRTLTTASPDRTREAALRRKYKHSYAARELEAQIVSDEHNADTIETLTLYIGNTHHLVKADQSGSKNTHNWKFFVRPSRTDLIEEVQVFLVSPKCLHRRTTVDQHSTQPLGTHGSYCNSRPTRSIVWAGVSSQFMPM